MGVPQDQIAAIAAQDEGDDGEIAVWPENWAVVTLFLAVETQWRVALGFGVAVHLGLDYAGVEAAMRRLRIEDKDGALFAGLQHMERAALPVLNEERS